jgi:RNA polymerase sigma factor (sigma-70 family)
MEAWAALDEDQLVALTLDGHTDAYGELIRRHQRAAYNAAYRLVGEQQQALDLAQDGFIRAFHALDRFDRTRPFGPWLLRIVTNAALNWLDRQRVPTVSLTAAGYDSAHTIDIADEAFEPERRYMQTEQRADLRRALLALPPRYRAVIELRHSQGLAYDEIAATLGIAVSAVKSDLFRARRRLRQLLEEAA